ncbi:MAG: hypothetical protein R3B99_20945 [Polyangiales bacterium]
MPREPWIGPPSDVYALGVMLFEMAVGKTPFEATPRSSASRHLFVNPKSLRELRPKGVTFRGVRRARASHAREEGLRATQAAQADRLTRLDVDATERMSPHADGRHAPRSQRTRMISRGASVFPPAFLPESR